MSFSINTATLVGNVTRDPELRYTPSGQPILKFGMATNRSIKKENNWQDQPTFHNVIVWGKIGEWLAANLHKGELVTVVGRIENRTYQDKQNQKHYTSEVVAEHVIPMKRTTGAKSTQTSANLSKPTQQPDDANPEGHDTGEETDPSQDVPPDDIPF
jgi:single-strand DNA-binding protein